jgi:hypothetical protein
MGYGVADPRRGPRWRVALQTSIIEGNARRAHATIAPLAFRRSATMLPIDKSSQGGQQAHERTGGWFEAGGGL